MPPPATAHTSAAAADPTDQIEVGLDQYGDQLAAVFVTETGSMKVLSAANDPSPSAAVANQEAGPVAEATKSSGDVVTKAKVHSTVLKIRIASLTSIVAHVSMSTELQLADDGTGNPDDSSW